MKCDLYDELSRLLTDYEGNGSDTIPTTADFYAMLVKIQNSWEYLTGETEATKFEGGHEHGITV